MPIIIIREQNVDGCGGFADVCVQCDDPVTSEQMMELHHELVRLTKELKDKALQTLPAQWDRINTVKKMTLAA